MRSWKETVMDRRKAGKIAGVALAGTLFVAGGTFLAANQFQNGREIVVANKENTLLTTSTPDLGQNNSVTAEKVAVKQKETITIHYKWKGKQPHLYYQVDKTGAKTSYPGVPMKDEGNGWYTYSVTNAEAANLKISVPSLDYQTSEFSRDAGEYWYDDENGWSLSAPANYTTPKDKEVVVDGKTLAATGNIVVHFPISEMKDAKIYYWNVLPTDMETDWPGETMSEKEKYYTYSFTATSKVNFLFTNGSEQTEDFTLKKAGEYWYADGKWVTTEPGTNPTNSPKPTATPIITPTEGDFRDETIYFLMTTRFYDGDSSNNRYCWDDEYYLRSETNNDPGWRGDFKGLSEKLDYIKALGFSAVWITPVVENASGLDYHGYHAYDFSKVDPRYESSDYTYQDLINDAHAKGIKIIQDIVLNHSGNWGEKNMFHMFDKDEDDGSDKSPFMHVAKDGNKADKLLEGVKKYGRGASDYDGIENLGLNSGEQGDAQYKSRLFAMKDDDIDTERLYHHYGNFQWESYGVQLGQMAGDCVDINTENPEYAKYLRECYINYINMGVDAFRIDTVKHISRLTFNKEFLPFFKEAGGKDFFMFGEACVRRQEVWNANMPGISVPFYTWKESKDYAWGDTATNEASAEKHFNDNLSVDIQPTSNNAFLNGNEYHTPDRSKSSGLDEIDFFMHWAFRNAGDAFRAGLSEDKYFNDSTYNVTYIDSHDYAPDQSPENQRFTGTQDTWAENLNLIFTFRGIPCIYYGSEIEFKKGCLIDPMMSSNGGEGSGTPYEKSGRAYFGDHIEGTVNTTDYGVYSGATGAMSETLNYPLAKHIQRLNLIRRVVPALRKGQYSTEGCNGGISYKRRYTADGVDSFVCVTISGDATFSGVPSGTYVDVVTGDKVECNGTLNAKCSGKGNMRVYVLQTAGAPSGKIGEDGAYLK